MTLTFELGWDFCKMYLTAKFDRPTFGHLEVTSFEPVSNHLRTTFEPDSVMEFCREPAS